MVPITASPGSVFSFPLYDACGAIVRSVLLTGMVNIAHDASTNSHHGIKARWSILVKGVSKSEHLDVLSPGHHLKYKADCKVHAWHISERVLAGSFPPIMKGLAQ
jgi:hypothetical protein